MNFPHTFRKNAWAFSPSELLTSVLIVIFFLLSLGAVFAERSGAQDAFQQAALSLFLWGGWMYFVAVRKPPPFGFWGLAKGLAPWGGLVLCYGLMKPLVPVLHPQYYDAALRGLDLKMLGRGPSLVETFLWGRPIGPTFFPSATCPSSPGCWA